MLLLQHLVDGGLIDNHLYLCVLIYSTKYIFIIFSWIYSFFFTNRQLKYKKANKKTAHCSRMISYNILYVYNNLQRCITSNKLYAISFSPVLTSKRDDIQNFTMYLANDLHGDFWLQYILLERYNIFFNY